jgi:hypothetical protein
MPTTDKRRTADALKAVASGLERQAWNAVTRDETNELLELTEICLQAARAEIVISSLREWLKLSRQNIGSLGPDIDATLRHVEAELDRLEKIR